MIHPLASLGVLHKAIDEGALDTSIVQELHVEGHNYYQRQNIWAHPLPPPPSKRTKRMFTSLLHDTCTLLNGSCHPFQLTWNLTKCPAAKIIWGGGGGGGGAFLKWHSTLLIWCLSAYHTNRFAWGEGMGEESSSYHSSHQFGGPVVAAVLQIWCTQRVTLTLTITCIPYFFERGHCPLTFWAESTLQLQEIYVLSNTY